MMRQSCRSDLPARRTIAFFLLGLILISTPVAGQTGLRRDVGAASTSRVDDAILGVRIGMSLESARKTLDPLSAVTRPAMDRDADKDEDRDRDDDEGAAKLVWGLKGTDYSSVALKVNSKGRVVWVTGFVRPGKELLFSELGDTSLAVRATDSQAIWNVATRSGGYRLVAKGESGKARVIYLLSLATR